MIDETPRTDADDVEAYRALEARAGAAGYATVNDLIDVLEAMKTEQDQHKLPLASPKLGEPVEVGGHDEDRDGPIPFGN